jgi:DNA mismatch repair protein MutS
MNETANILRTAGEKSLVIMDEVGRGTGTGDGLAIAWAVCEELLENVKARTLFATHYHELSLISHPRLANRSMDVLERNGEIIFLRKLREGPAAESYGIHVAGLAGLPQRVLERAEELLARIRSGENSTLAGNSPAPLASSARPASSGAREKNGELEKAIAKLDLNDITPLEALNVLQGLKNMIARNSRDSGGGSARRLDPGSAQGHQKSPSAEKPRKNIEQSLFD